MSASVCDSYVFLFFVVLGLINKDFLNVQDVQVFWLKKKPISGYYETKVITISIILIILETKNEIGIIWLAILSEM